MGKISGFANGFLAFAVLAVPTVLSAANLHYKGVIEVKSGATSLGYIAPDPNYWTPLLTPDVTSALKVEFTLNGNNGTVNLTQTNDNRGTYFAPVVGRDSTSSDIAAGSFNYLYLDPVAAPGTPVNSTPQSIPSFFSTSTLLDKQAETTVWVADISALTVALQWVNTDGSKPATVVFVQSNHVYGGGDADAFHSRFPAPVTIVTLHLVNLESTPVLESDLTITKTHTGKFLKGPNGGTYAITVTNAGALATSGTVMVTDTLPAGLTAAAMGGTGWGCTLATLVCTRNDALNPAASYPPINLTVNVSPSAPASVTNQASVSGGSETNTANNSASDVTEIVAGVDVSGQVNVTLNSLVRNRATGLWVATMTLYNVSPSVIPGPIQLVLTNLTPGVTVVNPTGVLNGAPYITVSPNNLPLGGALPVQIQFANPTNGPINFVPKVFSGAL